MRVSVWSTADIFNSPWKLYCHGIKYSRHANVAVPSVFSSALEVRDLQTTDTRTHTGAQFTPRCLLTRHSNSRMIWFILTFALTGRGPDLVCCCCVRQSTCGTSNVNARTASGRPTGRHRDLGADRRPCALWRVLCEHLGWFQQGSEKTCWG